MVSLSYFRSMKALCTIFFISSFLTATAQYDPARVAKKAMKLYEQSMEVAGDGNFTEGIRLLKEAVKIDNRFEDAHLSIAGMYGEMKQYDSAILYYEKARSIDSIYFKDYNLPYSINLAGAGKFEEALQAADIFLSIINLNATSVKAASFRKRCYQFALEYKQQQQNNAYEFLPHNMGNTVNSAVSEYYPTFTIDGKQLIYTRRVNNSNEDFFQSDRTDSSWQLSAPLKGNINSNFNEGAQTISQDGQWLIFTGCNFPEGFGSCDLYISFLTPDGWSTPENMGGRINSDAWESAPTLSPDKKDLYFASRRYGGFGGSDIYVSHRLPNGRWSEPENLGPDVNTSGDESCPFIHADNQTLYFTSNGLQGYGGDDLFLVRKGPKAIWSKPINLGYPINTIENEGSLVIAADGKTAYYASDRSDTRGGLDLYTFTLRSDVQPIRTLWVKGKVFDNNTKKGLPSAVELTDLTTKEAISKVQTDEKGNYLITLPVGRDYAFNVNRRSYLFYSENFPLSEKAPDSVYNIDIALKPIDTNATVVLKNIFFDVNKFELKPASQVELDILVKLMKENPTLVVQLSGHTDNVGKEADNIKLSTNRAKAVVEYLTANAIDAKRLLHKGYGSAVPVADNVTEEGRSKNRRTELKIVKQ
jgi:outer membrane protein OmpA-like peptidoglycan-associated protein/Tfp pilus assembly protein PilF